MPRGTYVTSHLVDIKGGSRQGVYYDDNSDGTIQVQGISGEVYHCSADATIVPDSNLLPDVRHFVQALRKQNELDYRWRRDFGT